MKSSIVAASVLAATVAFAGVAYAAPTTDAQKAERACNAQSRQKETQDHADLQTASVAARFASRALGFGSLGGTVISALRPQANAEVRNTGTEERLQCGEYAVR